MANMEESTVVSAPVEKAFEFFRRPQQIVEISDPAIGTRIVEAPEVLSHGDRFRVQLLAFGTVRTVVYEAAIDEANRLITERMVEGDLKAWSHAKSFQAQANDCLVTDSIEFLPPGGLAGFLMTADKIEDQVANGISYRNERLQQAIDAFRM